MRAAYSKNFQMRDKEPKWQGELQSLTEMVMKNSYHSSRQHVDNLVENTSTSIFLMKEHAKL